MTEDKTLTDNDQIIPLIRQHFPALQERFNVADLAVFGSVARGQAREDTVMWMCLFALRVPRRPRIISGYSFIWKICWGGMWTW